MCYIYTKMLYLHSIIRLRRASFYGHILLSVSIYCIIFLVFFIDSQPNGDILSVFRSYNNNNSGFTCI